MLKISKNKVSVNDLENIKKSIENIESKKCDYKLELYSEEENLA